MSGGIHVGIKSSAEGLDVCARTVGSKNYKSINEKSNKKHDKTVLLAKIDSDVTQNEHNSVTSLWKEYNDLKKQAKTL